MNVYNLFLHRRKTILLFFILLVNTYILCIPVPHISAKEDWEDQPLEWYYDNLTDEDRKKIRQAMDYCIPRQQIIDGLMKGYGIPIASEVGAHMYGYDPSIQARKYNTSKAQDLLTEVFGKRFDNMWLDESTTTVTNVPYFKITLISPVNNDFRSQWASMVAFALINVGIDVELKWWNMNLIENRIFLDPGEPTGASYEIGGFDAYFFNPTSDTDVYLSHNYFNNSFAPAGNNTMYIERADVQSIIQQSLSDPIEMNRLQALSNFQSWSYEWIPKSIIYQDLDLYPHDPELTGFDSYNYGRSPWVHNLTHATETNFTSLVPSNFVDFNPLVSNSWYDSVPMSNCFLSLTARRGSYNLSAYPLLANNWTSTSDGKNWTIHLKQDVKFEDGTEVTAEDVVETYRVAMNASTSTYAGDMRTWFASDQDIYAINNYSLQMNLQKFYPYVRTGVFGLPILKMEQLREIGIENLKTDITNTHAVGLLGNGPYKISDYDRNTITLVTSPYYNGTILGHDPENGIWLNSTGGFETYICKVIEKFSDVEDYFENDTCDLLDPNYDLLYYNSDYFKEHPELAKIISFPDFGWNELVYNHYDPRWGLNPHNPRILPRPSSTDSTSFSSTSHSTAYSTSSENTDEITSSDNSDDYTPPRPSTSSINLFSILLTSLGAFGVGLIIAALFEKFR